MNPVEMLNITMVQELTTEKFIEVANKSITMPSLILFFILIALIFLIVGLVFVKESRVKYLGIWFTSVILGIVILIMFILMPQVMYNLLENIKGLF